MLSSFSRFATAAHLALLATAPFLLLPALGPHATAVAVLWLTPFALLWTLLAPARGDGVPIHDARVYVARALRRDPLVPLLLILALYAGIRALNGGVSLAFDAEIGRWMLTTPCVPWLPGCVDGTGFLPFAMTVALAVVLPGARHALGPDARVSFLLCSSLFSGIAGGWMAYAAASGDAALHAAAACSYRSASFVGTAFGFQLLAGVTAHFGVLERKWLRIEPISLVALAGNALALAVFAPVAEIAAFVAALFALMAVSFLTERRALSDGDSLRCVLAVLLALSTPVLYAMVAGGGCSLSAKMGAVQALKPFPDGFVAARDALSHIASRTWIEHPWLGTGLGSFPLDLRFFGTARDWAVIPPGQATALNGWWSFLVERGVVGALVAASAVGWILWSYVSLAARKGRPVLRAEHVLGPVAALAFVAVTFVSCTLSRAETVLSVTSLLALSVGAWVAPGRKAG